MAEHGKNSGEGSLRPGVKVLQITARDVTVKKLILPLIDRLTAEGYQVVSACRPGSYTPELQDQGYSMRPIDIDRRLSPGANTRAVWQLYRLMRRERFDIVHVHTPVAAALGRIAARLARVPIIIYTAHGFYHHDNMQWRNKQACMWSERILGRTATHMLFTQSQEDADSAVADGICSAGRVVWISNGVDLDRFRPGPPCPEAKESFGLIPGAPVIGFMGPLVAEKGVLELLGAFQQALASKPDLYLLLAGDVIHGDRDLETKEVIRNMVAQGELASRVVFAGYVEDVARFMRAVDVFALPSRREGMPRSIIEAMASGKPVIATDIRGCREEVVHGVTGLIVPLRDSKTLAEAMVQVTSNPGLAADMGQAAHQRAEALFDEAGVLERQVAVYQRLVQERLSKSSARLVRAPAKARYEEGTEVGKS